MLNYGLYAGIDAVIGIVEPHRNSVKVFEQIQNICRKTMIPCFAVINKPVDNEFYRDFIARYATIILGEIPFDPSILDYDYTALRHSTKESAVAIIEKISKLSKRGNLNSGKEFDTPQGA
jgi:CO dehydrogenase nickel-insertion accessory protein CooC1